tara:strand:- start:465 stop:1052 length:588 start_codon:yes stop_codon:yes gene_type:complete
MSYPFDYNEDKKIASQSNPSLVKEEFGMEDLPQKYFNDYSMQPANPEENTIQYIKNAIGQNETEITEVAKVFFSENNILLINRKLVLKVFEVSKNTVKIPFQSRDDLLVIMRYIYISYSQNLNKKVERQVAELNCRVVKEIMPSILSNIDQYMKYLKEIEKNETNKRELNELPKSTKMTRGTVELPAMSDIYSKK